MATWGIVNDHEAIVNPRSFYLYSDELRIWQHIIKELEPTT
jgi:hypothetical protein